MASSKPEIILFTYDISVYGRKVDDYLTLRRLPYTRCIVPPIMPRSVLASLGIAYRRIPIMAIGRDIYCDTRTIIPKLEESYPSKRLGSTTSFSQAIEYLLENFINDGGPFWRTAQMIPPELVSESFARDRSEMTGRKFEREGREAMRPEAMAHSRMYFEMTEEKLLGDGREFVLGTEGPGLADVHAAWLFDWAVGLAGMRQRGERGEVIGKEAFPRVFAWLERYKDFVKKVQERDGRAPVISDEEAVELILRAGYSEVEGDVDSVDPLQLKKGQLMEMWPTDSGMNHHDRGELVSIGVKEVCVKSEVPGGKGHLRIHYPRTNFKIAPAQESRL